jgi:hypothetical protein
MKKAIIAVSVLLIFGGYFYLSKPDKIVINEKGKVAGLENKARMLLQGSRFWALQLRLANEEFNRIEVPQKPSSAEMQELYKKMREAERALDEKMKVLYSAEEEQALQLRLKADSLERSGKWKRIDDEAECFKMKELEKLKTIIPIIEKKLHIPKP